MSRIAHIFAEAETKQEKAFIPYIMAGDPDIEMTVALMHTLAENGAHIIELGFPFSDPTADGPIIQAAAGRALKHSTDLRATLQCCKEFRKSNQHTGLVLMGYSNPLLQYGYDAVAQDMQDSGVDGIAAAF